MLNTTEILTKLYRLPELFREQSVSGEWKAAAMTYEKAVDVSTFIEMDGAARDKLLEHFDADTVENVYRKAGWYKEEADADRTGDRKKAV